MKKNIYYIVAGGVIGLGIHLVWHYSTGLSLLSVGPHAIKGTIYTVVGMIVGLMTYLIIPKK